MPTRIHAEWEHGPLFVHSLGPPEVDLHAARCCVRVACRCNSHPITLPLLLFPLPPPSLSPQDPLFVLDSLAAMRAACGDSNMSLRAKAHWALANACEALRFMAPSAISGATGRALQNQWE